MKRFLCTAILMSVLGLSVVGCGSDETSKGPAPLDLDPSIAPSFVRYPGYTAVPVPTLLQQGYPTSHTGFLWGANGKETLLRVVLAAHTVEASPDIVSQAIDVGGQAEYGAGYSATIAELVDAALVKKLPAPAFVYRYLSKSTELDVIGYNAVQAAQLGRPNLPPYGTLVVYAYFMSLP